MTEQEHTIEEMLQDARARDIFRGLVETYLATGEPVGSRTLSGMGGLGLSAATIRNVMADLTEMGLLYAPHTSAGRLPTERGLRLFVDGLLEIGDLPSEERDRIESQLAGASKSVEDLLSEASAALSGLTGSAGLVTTVSRDAPLKHIEFVSTGPGTALVVMVGEDGRIENRIIDAPAGLPPSAFEQATNYLNARLRGRTLAEAKETIDREIRSEKAELDTLTAKLVSDGVADWSGGGESSLIVRGRAHLLNDGAAAQDLQRVKMLFDDLEQKRDVLDLLDAAKNGEGVRIFIGSENRLFSLSGSSVIVKPYRDGQQRIVGVLGVIGPTRLNYARVIPMVDYTAEVVSRLLK